MQRWTEKGYLMYQSPIEIVDMQCLDALKIELLKAQEEEIYRAVVNVGINVDREELIRALAYDRGQYQKGFADATPKWIPVTERLPEEVATYLVLSKAGNCSVQWFHIYGENFKGFFDAEEPGKITHWMPLPEPPKDVDHGSV